jgi:hypothetical protein
MAEIRSQPEHISPEAAEEDERSLRKKRKVRKGTQSCWECKRRKIRCTFSSAADAHSPCDSCQRRRTACISQEFPNEPPPQTARDDFEGRFNRLERLVLQLNGYVKELSHARSIPLRCEADGLSVDPQVGIPTRAVPRSETRRFGFAQCLTLIYPKLC